MIDTRAQPSGSRPISALDQPIGSVLVVVGIAFLGMSKPQLVSNLVVTDVLLSGMIVIWCAHVWMGQGLSTREARAMAIPVSLIFAGSILASAYVGLQGFVVGDLVRDLGAFCGFLAAIDIFRRGGPAVVKWTLRAVCAAVVVLVLWLVLFDSTLRGRASFPNPNVPAHFLACAVILFALVDMPRAARVIMVCVSLVGIYRTGSFGASLQIGAALSYVGVTRVISRTRNRERTRAAFFAGVALCAVAVAVAVSAYLGRAAANDESGLSSKRLTRSSSTRFSVWGEALSNWRQHPFGTGPGSSRALRLLASATEPHNEPLAYLSERGPIALVGLMLLWFAIWKMGSPQGITRALLCGYLVASVFRETLHYRHWWLLLAFAVVVDHSGVGSTRAVIQPNLGSTL